MAVMLTILAVELDAGTVFLADREIALGADRCHGAIVSVGEASVAGASLEIERQALPPWAQAEWWINREAMLLECDDTMQSVYDGRVIFDGIVAAQPEESVGVLTVVLGPRVRRVIPVPDFGLITRSEYPQAPDASVGVEKPLIFGTVEKCPLIPVAQPAMTRLANNAAAGTDQLAVESTAGFAAAGSVWIDGKTYTYTSKSETGLYGMALTSDHKGGTLVAQTGNHVWLAAGHTCASIADVRADDVAQATATVDAVAGTVTFAAPPTNVDTTERYNVELHFDAASGSTCSLPTNAIQAIISDYSNVSPSAYPVAITRDAPGEIVWSRPADGNRIVRGYYTVSFSISGTGTQIGRAEVQIGNDVAYVWQPGVGVLYNNSGGTFELHEDTDRLPITVTVEENGNAALAVGITTAVRRVLTGNLDQANYATIAPGQTLAVQQTDTPPDRGSIDKAWVIARWFATNSNVGSVPVVFDGRSLGDLKQTVQASQTLNETLSIDKISTGSVSVAGGTVSASVSGGSASLNHNLIARREVITPTFSVVGVTSQTRSGNTTATVAGVYFSATSGIETNMLVEGPGIGAGAYVTSVIGGTGVSISSKCAMNTTGETFTFRPNPLSSTRRFQGKVPEMTGYSNGNAILVTTIITAPSTPSGILTVEFRNSGGGTFASISTMANSWTNVGTNTWQNTTYIYQKPDSVVVTDLATQQDVQSISFDYNATLTSSAVSQNWTAASASTSSTLASQTPTVSGANPGFITGYDGSTPLFSSSKTLSITVPSPPRVSESWLPLSWVRQWSQLANKGMSIAVVNGSASICIIETFVAVEYDMIARQAAESLTASVTGLSGNPADVITYLAGKSGETLQAASVARYRDWCAGAGLMFGRRVAKTSDTLQLLAFALEQGGADIFDRGSEKHLQRLADISSFAVRIAETDWIDAPRIGWADRVENDLTLKYRETESDGFAEVLQATAGNNIDCAASVRAVLETRSVTIEGGWLRDDAAASLALSDIARRVSPLRRTLSGSLPCTFTTEIESGGLIEYADALWRISAIADDAGWPQITAEELPWA